MTDKTQRDLKGKGETGRDVIRQALQCENLGPDASVSAVREWIEWKFPVVPLPNDFEKVVEDIRRQQKASG